VRDALVWEEKERQSVGKPIFIGVIAVGEVRTISEERVYRHYFSYKVTSKCAFDVTTRHIRCLLS